MQFTQLRPFGKFFVQSFRRVNRQGNQRRSDADQNKPPEYPLPEWLKLQLGLGAKKTGEAQPAFIGAKRFLPELVVPDCSVEAAGERSAQFAQALQRTFPGRIVCNANSSRVARVIAVGNHQIAGTRAADELIQQMI